MAMSQMSDLDGLGLAQKYFKIIRESGINVDKAYLFGSFAKGKTWAGSDL